MNTSDTIAVYSLIISFIALIASIIFFAVNRKYTRSQISISQSQFAQENIPVVTTNVFCGNGSAYLTAKNEDPSVVITEFTATLVGQSNNGASLDFPFPDLPCMLRPGAYVQVQSSRTITEIFAEYGGSNAQFIMDDNAKDGGIIARFFLSLDYNYLPQQDGAKPVYRSRYVSLTIT